MKTIETTLNFGGFYGSIHSYNIDSQVELFEEPNDNETNEPILCFNEYRALYIAYAKKYVDFINELTGSTLDFKSLYSPKYYNYSTDQIDVYASNTDMLILIKYLKKNDLKEYFFDHLIEKCTTKSGYIANYRDFELFQKENKHMLLQLVLDTIINNSESEFESYYDMQCVYELIYSI